jgi:hypothetical protein
MVINCHILNLLSFPWSASRYLPISKHTHESYEVWSLEEACGEGDREPGTVEDEEEEIGKWDGADASPVMKEGHEVNTGDNRVLGLGAGASS